MHVEEAAMKTTDERGVRWYQLLPWRRRRYDVFGFNYTWWLIWIALGLGIFLPRGSNRRH
jgi:hypothetical protein